MICSVQALSRQSDRGTVDESRLCSQCVSQWSTDSGAHSKSNFENFWKQINTSLTGAQCRWKSEITHNLPTQTITLQQLQARRNHLKSDDKKHTYMINRETELHRTGSGALLVVFKEVKVPQNLQMFKDVFSLKLSSLSVCVVKPEVLRINMSYNGRLNCETSAALKTPHQGTPPAWHREGNKSKHQKTSDIIQPLNPDCQ
ncbi:hypothetical protein F7725_025628, partial [Dissostichus mawsoni]